MAEPTRASPGARTRYAGHSGKGPRKRGSGVQIHPSAGYDSADLTPIGSIETGAPTGTIHPHLISLEKVPPTVAEFEFTRSASCEGRKEGLDRYQGVRYGHVYKPAL